MKKQRRFTTEAQIMLAIDKAHARMADRLSEATLLDAEADGLFKHKDTIEDAKTKRLEAKKKRKVVWGIEQNLLPRLKNTLAAFRTEMLLDKDNKGVVMGG